MSKPSVVTKYLNKLDVLYKEHNIYTRLDALVASFICAKPHQYTPLIIKFNLMDAEKCRYMEAAHKLCNWSPPQGAYAWSPKLERVGQTITYWKS